MKRSDRQRKSGGGSGMFVMLVIEKITSGGGDIMF